jgi:hypothetical protein
MAPADDTSERGQILIIVGLLVAVMLVALALVLNSAIFAENLSTRETADSEEPSAYAVDAESTVADVYDRTNANDTRKAVYANTSFNESFETWADSRSDTAAENGALFEADWTAYVGWRLEQTENRSFTPANDPDATEWVLSNGTNVRNVSTFKMDVSRDDLYEGDDQDDVKNNAFNLFVTDGTDDWELFVYRTGGNMVVNDTATSDKCTSGSSRAEIIVRAGGGEFDGSCDELDLPSALDDDLQVEFRNVQATDGTERVNGTYTLVVNGSDAIARDAGGHPERFNASGKTPPTATAVVYAVRYDTRYQRKEVVHDVEGWHSPREETYQPS